MKSSKIENLDEIYKKDTLEEILENKENGKNEKYEELNDEFDETDILSDDITVIEMQEKKNEFEKYDDERDEFDFILDDKENISVVEAYMENRQKGRNNWDYTDAEIQQMMDEDTNEISFGITEAEKKDSVLETKDDTNIENLSEKKSISSEENGMRNSYWVDSEGIHHDDWNSDAVEGTEQLARLESGTLLERHVFKGTERDTGIYMAPYGTEFDNKQLNYLEAAYDKNIYVVNQPFNVIQSEVGKQGWQKADSALQYKLENMTVQDLLESKIITKITPEEAEELIRTQKK